MSRNPQSSQNVETKVRFQLYWWWVGSVALTSGVSKDTGLRPSAQDAGIFFLRGVGEGEMRP